MSNMMLKPFSLTSSLKNIHNKIIIQSKYKNQKIINSENTKTIKIIIMTSFDQNDLF